MGCRPLVLGPARIYVRRPPSRAQKLDPLADAAPPRPRDDKGRFERPPSATPAALDGWTATTP